jgi:purine-cytosine permease-like protein
VVRSTEADIKLERSKRHYHSWVVNETLEDYSLRYAPKSFRRWSEFTVANTALGGISYLADFAIGGSIAISSGFTNSLWAILLSAVIIFVTGIPISYYAARYNIDMDLLTRGAGFGYIGSTLTSVIYASFCFIFFALEGAIMAQALELYFKLPLGIGYFICTIAIFPLVVFGMTLLAQMQVWTQPLWLVGMFAPWFAVLIKDPTAFSTWTSFAGKSPSGSSFDLLLCASGMGVALSLIAQIGEQVDYLRFMPDLTADNKGKWWTAVIASGPGWVILGAWKQLAGAFFTAVAVKNGVAMAKANEPIQMYVEGFKAMFGDPTVYLFLATFFVILSQVKINVTNAYSGSLSWSNFFSRLTHAHPGRVVWLVFHLIISLVLQEMGVFDVLLWVLGFYSNVAIAWVGALVADLVVLKPLGISPSYIEFKRAHLYNFNPVGFGSMTIASIVSMIAFFGLMGPAAQAFSTLIALGLAFVLALIIAVITKGKYYIARQDVHFHNNPNVAELTTCSICETAYEREDMAHCPVYEGAICSLCCSLDSQCHDACKSVPSTI